MAGRVLGVCRRGRHAGHIYGHKQEQVQGPLLTLIYQRLRLFDIATANSLHKCRMRNNLLGSIVVVSLIETIR